MAPRRAHQQDKFYVTASGADQAEQAQAPDDAGREIELKFDCSDTDLAALAAHPLLRKRKGAHTKSLVSTYFDTPAHDLRRAGLTLRVRADGSGFVQTVKSGEGAAGLFERPEWESPVSENRPEAAVFADTPVAAVLEAAEEPSLAPVFATRVKRLFRPVIQGTSRIAATLDDGRVETASGQAPLRELELELASGDPADLFALARALTEAAPLRLGALSKSERGFRLLDGTAGPSKAIPLTLSHDASAADAFRAVARACLRQLRLNEAVFLASRDPEALHQIRVSLRRLRSAFSLFAPILDHDPAAREWSETIKARTEPFGRARNLDVFLETTLPAEAERRPDEPGLSDLTARIARERDEAHDAVVAILGSTDWVLLILDLLAWIETGPWLGAGGPPERDGSARDFAAATLDRFRKRVKKRGKHLADLDPEARHRVRIAAKKLRYGADFFASLFPEKSARKRHKAFAAALSDLQDHLGALNDLATAHDVLGGLAEDGASSGPALFAAGLTAADNEAGAKALIEAASEAYDDLVDAKPFWR